jgi:hypothetical protein
MVQSDSRAECHNTAYCFAPLTLLQRSFGSRSSPVSIETAAPISHFQCPLPADCRLPLATTSDFHRTIVQPYEPVIFSASTSLKHQPSVQVPLGRDWKPLYRDGSSPHLPPVMTHPVCEWVQNRSFYPLAGSKTAPSAFVPTRAETLFRRRFGFA